MRARCPTVILNQDFVSGGKFSFHLNVGRRAHTIQVESVEAPPHSCFERLNVKLLLCMRLPESKGQKTSPDVHIVWKKRSDPKPSQNACPFLKMAEL